MFCDICLCLQFFHYPRCLTPVGPVAVLLRENQNRTVLVKVVVNICPNVTIPHGCTCALFAECDRPRVALTKLRQRAHGGKYSRRSEILFDYGREAFEFKSA